jgi:hypothetical protein
VTCFEYLDARAAAHLKSIPVKPERDKGFIGEQFDAAASNPAALLLAAFL